MNSLLEKLYGGELYPSEQIIPADPEYRPISRKAGEERESLKKKLSAEDSDRLENLHDMYMQTCSMTCYAGFSYGFKLGARLMLEIISDSEEIES